jgi:two-component system, NarL family, response regulator LiaR
MISEVRLHSLPGEMVFDELEHVDRLHASTLERWHRARVLIASPHPIVRHGLRALLTVESDLEVVAETDNGAAAVALARQLRPDVVLIDLQMPQVDGIIVTRLIRAESTDTQIVVLAGVHDDTRAIEAIRAGASACLNNEASTDVYLRTIRDVSLGHVSLPSQLAARLMRVVDRQEVLSERETQVLRLVASGKSNKLIARELVIAESTVKSHVGSILNKLGLESRTQLALHAARTGLVALDQPELAM